MGNLPPAGLLTRIWTSLFPKSLRVEVRTELLEDGNFELKPIYTIDGQIVPPEFISNSPTQTILGYTVNLGPGARIVQKETGGQRRRLSKKHAAEFLGQMSHHGVRLRSKGNQVPPLVSVVKPDVKVVLNDDDSLEVETTLTTPKGLIIEKPTTLEDLQREDGWFVSGGDLYRAAPTGSHIDGPIFTQAEPSTLVGDDVPRFLQELERHETEFSSVEKNARLEGLSVYGDKHENRVRVDGDKESIRLEPALVYFGKDEQTYQPTVEEVGSTLSRGGGFKRIPEGWLELDAKVASSHNAAVTELRNRFGNLNNIRGIDIPRTLRAIVDPKMFATPWAVYFSEEVKNSHRIVETPSDTRFTLNVVESDGRALLELDARYNHDRFRLSHSEISDAVDHGKEWIRRENAWVKIDRSRYDVISKTISKLGLEKTQSGARFPASRREEVVLFFSVLGSIEHSESYSAFLNRLADFNKIEEVPLPSSLRSGIQLRPYQQHGYNWLTFLRHFGLNGILADDMGLGKTLQTLAAIKMEHERTGTSQASLVICPTSLVANWKKEAAKFFTHLDVRTYTGSKRERVLGDLGLDGSDLFGRKSRRCHLVVTTFGIALRDQEQLSRIPWLYVIVDEAHQIKNPSAKRTRAIKTINGQHKLALTGTPIQNNLDELWSLFDFTMPGYLGSRGRFREQYGNGKRIDWAAVRHEKTGLRNRIHPFVMRRLKEEVATDLPEKVLIKQPVELSPLQVKLYKETLKSTEFKKLVEAVDAKGVERSSAEILAIYTRLRTICNHPALATPQRDGDIRLKDSGKLDALKELMIEVQEGGHRALIFCQSTKMLDIIGQFFKEWGTAFLRLDGNTAPSTRQDLVDEFNRDASIPAFLISTKAGGTGLNLTGADTVIFYDHDWNPANDNQAQDRAYRIGQSRKVTVYKLVSVGTIEERIIERQ